MVSTEVVVALITLIGVVITAAVSVHNARVQSKAKKALDEVNDAVNHRHEKHGPDALKLYDLAVENHQRTDRLEKTVKIVSDKVHVLCDRVDGKVSRSECQELREQGACGLQFADSDATEKTPLLDTCLLRPLCDTSNQPAKPPQS